MAVFPGSYVLINASSSDRVNEIVDNLLTPRLLYFRQAYVNDEEIKLMPDGVTWKASYGNWNQDYTEVIRKNSEKLASGQYTITSYPYGTLTLAVAPVAGDNVNASYNFDYFPVSVLEGYIKMVIDIINTGAVGPPTEYTIDNAPSYWNGVIADLVFAVCMERLITDYTLWYGRVIFAIPGIEEAGDIVSTLETLKQNAEERANMTMENEKFKVGNHLALPTAAYYAAVRGFGGVGYGRLRGIKINRWWGL